MEPKDINRREMLLGGAALLLAAVCALPSAAWAMPGIDHSSLAELLTGTPASQGGVGSLTGSQLNGVGQRMDQLSQVLGPTHGMFDHNPSAIAGEMSRSGLGYEETLNAARLHKIGDVAHNKMPVDGWEITPKMQEQASGITEYVRKNGRLPKRLPGWVDNSGPLLEGKQEEVVLTAGSGTKAFLVRGAGVIALTTVVSGGRNGYSYLKRDISAQEALASVGTDDASAGTSWLATEGVVAVMGDKVVLAIRTGTGVGVAYFVFSATRDVISALRGATNPNDLSEKMLDNGIKGLAAGVGTGVIIAAMSNPGTAAVALTGLGVVLVVEYAYPKVKALFDKRYLAQQAYYARLPDSFKQVCPLEWIKETKPLEKFGKTYGPRFDHS